MSKARLIGILCLLYALRIFRWYWVYLRPKRALRKRFRFAQNGKFVHARRAIIDSMLYDLISTAETLGGVLKPDLALNIIKARFGAKVQRNIQYAPRSRCQLDIYPPTKLDDATSVNHLAPVMIFVHGGAWSWGHKWQYASLASRLADLGSVVIATNYRVYPTGNCDDMIEDLVDALGWVIDHVAEYGGNSHKIYLIGHSAGAHLCAQMVALLAQKIDPKLTYPVENRSNTNDGQMQFSALTPEPDLTHLSVLNRIVGVIGLSGVYDIRAHYAHEMQRSVGVWPIKLTGVHSISPMEPAMNGLEHCDRHSPLYVVHRLTPEQTRHLPQFYLIHGGSDTTVPVRSSFQFYKVLEYHGVPAILATLEGIDHTMMLLSTMDGAKDRTVAAPIELLATSTMPTHTIKWLSHISAPIVAQSRSNLNTQPESFTLYEQVLWLMEVILLSSRDSMETTISS